MSGRKKGKEFMYPAAGIMASPVASHTSTQVDVFS